MLRAPAAVRHRRAEVVTRARHPDAPEGIVALVLAVEADVAAADHTALRSRCSSYWAQPSPLAQQSKQALSHGLSKAHPSRRRKNCRSRQPHAWRPPTQSSASRSQACGQFSSHSCLQPRGRLRPCLCPTRAGTPAAPRSRWTPGSTCRNSPPDTKRCNPRCTHSLHSDVHWRRPVMQSPKAPLDRRIAGAAGIASRLARRTGTLARLGKVALGQVVGGGGRSARDSSRTRTTRFGRWSRWLTPVHPVGRC